MKRLLLAAGLAALLGAGLCWSVRREPSSAPLEGPGDAFSVGTAGQGQLIRLQDEQAPLRTLGWIAPVPGGLLAAQVLGQNDRQRVVLFQEGLTQETLLVLKPVGVSEGFWRFAVLRAAVLAPAGPLLLLYQAADPASPELPLVLALDRSSQQVLWYCRAAGDRLALTPGAEAVYLYGAKGPITRLALAPAGAALQGGPHPQPLAVDLPPEVPGLDALLPTGAWSFLVSHPNGLSAYRAKAGWTHFPLPDDRGVACAPWQSALARSGKDLWWQPFPGQLVRLHADGRPGLAWQPALAEADPFARDAGLLRLLGADAAGSLWFALARPVLPVVPAEPPAQPDAAPAPPADAPSGTQAAPLPQAPDWGAYLAQGLDRLYRWNPAGKTLQRVAPAGVWAALNPPPAVGAPAPERCVPAAGALLAEGPHCLWWLPLPALPMETVPLQLM